MGNKGNGNDEQPKEPPEELSEEDAKKLLDNVIMKPKEKD